MADKNLDNFFNFFAMIFLVASPFAGYMFFSHGLVVSLLGPCACVLLGVVLRTLDYKNTPPMLWTVAALQTALTALAVYT